MRGSKTMNKPVIESKKVRKKFDRAFKERAVELWLNSGRGGPEGGPGGGGSFPRPRGSKGGGEQGGGGGAGGGGGGGGVWFFSPGGWGGGGAESPRSRPGIGCQA